jgi:hypothetical protein
MPALLPRDNSPVDFHVDFHVPHCLCPIGFSEDTGRKPGARSTGFLPFVERQVPGQ